MSGIVNKVVKLSSFGLIDDVTGVEAQQREARRAGDRSAAAGEAAIARGEAAAAPFAALGNEAAPMLSQLLQEGQPQAQSAQQVIDNPFFQSLSQDQDQRLLSQRAALGLAGSGGTQDSLTRQQMLLGNHFQQQDLSNQQIAQGNRFNQLFNTTQLGANAAIGEAGSAGNILTNIANAQNAAGIGAANANAAFTGQVLQLGGAALGGAFGGGFGAAAGGALGGALGGGGAAAPSPSFFGTGPVQGGNFSF